MSITYDGRDVYEGVGKAWADCAASREKVKMGRQMQGLCYVVRGFGVYGELWDGPGWEWVRVQELAARAD